MILYYIIKLYIYSNIYVVYWEYPSDTHVKSIFVPELSAGSVLCCHCSQDAKCDGNHLMGRPSKMIMSNHRNDNDKLI